MILNTEQLQARARALALTHDTASARRPEGRFLPRFRADVDSLHQFAVELTRHKSICVQPAEDWLLDHIAFLETQAHVVMRELPRNVLRLLPRLQGSGAPRVYALCDAYLEAVDGRYDPATLTRFLQAYQQVSVLKTIECWVLPSAMRVAIIRQLAAVMRVVRHHHQTCERIHTLLTSARSRSLTSEDIRGLLEDSIGGRELTATEVVHWVRHLSEWNADIKTVREWLIAHVENGMHSLEQMVSYERELQADQQVMCGNLVRSLHALERHPWRQTFIAISEVEQRLLQDATGDYERMDMESRDVLRQRVVRVAQQLRVPETLVAETAVRLAKREWDLVNDTQTDIPRSACLAFYLLHPEGLRALRGAIREQTRPRPLPRWVFRRHPLASYLTGLALLFAAGLIAVGTVVGRSGVASPWAWVAVLLAIAIPVSEWAVTVAHSWIEHRCRPTPLLRYDFSEELPDDAKTLVVVPVLWSSIAEVDEVMETLRVHYLANRQRNIHFAVLSDFPDAPTAEHPEDAELVEHAVAVVNDLRREYGADTFFLFHRARRHNAADNVYMGWERKRGKLVELAEYLAGKRETSFETVVGEESVLPQIRYILTVDADTKLPIGVVGRLAGTIHLPYNRPRLNASGTRVVAGYGVIQPRVGASYASVQASRFAALWAGQPGVDPYAFAVSNPYQDWFDQAVFVGKGIFDVAVFRRVLADRIPDNQVLSHDVLEGGFLRAGLASDIEVVEAHPETIYAYQRRQHRWVRGDWQLLRWLGRVCPNRAGERQLNDLCGIARWHIVDHCRRSLLHPALFVVSALGAGWLPGSPAAWEGLVLLTLFLPALRAAVLSVGGRQRGRDVVVATAQCLVQALVLPFTAVLQVDAVARSLYRMGVSHRRLLEWVPSAHTDREANGGRVFVYEPAGYAAALAWVAAAFASGTQTGRASAVLALGLWLAARPVARWLGRPRRHPKRPWLQQAEPNLRGLAEKIWAYYNHYVTEADLWLPPDNVQYHPRETVAHRTSPTNIGLYLACVVAAWDLGMIDAADMLDRLERTLKTVASLEKWHGHLYNWYDTQTGRPLPPRYVSTVDSGNLVTCLMVVHEALRGCGERYPQWAIRVTALRETVDQLVTATDFRPLYNADERLLSLGHHVDAERKDDILYDLLASEARQASFVAIALGQVPVTHWFTLARTMTRVARWKTLLSWSGTMFEYLMPSLVMRTYPGTIWAETYEGVIHRQRAFAERNGVPFGISESGYYAFDYQHNYQYRAFGVPGLGLDRGLEQQLVTAPYAALLALPFAGEVALEALRKYERLGAMGPYGYYEAVDFTKRRLPPGSRHEVVKSFMAHHQGMGLLAIANLLCDESIIRRFHAHPNVRAAELLLQERAPTRVSWTVQTAHRDAKPPAFDAHRHTGTRTFHAPTPLPEVNVLSNGRITSVLTQDGTGMLLWNGASVTRWREDAAMDRSGIAVYIHNPLTDETWSPARYPCASADTDWNVQFRLDKTCYETLQNGVESRYEVAVSPHLDAEVRRLKLINRSQATKTLEVTSYLELALAPQSTDSAHPAFSKLFVQTQYERSHECLLAKRRPRDAEEKERWAGHSVLVDGPVVGDVEYETDRAAFIGRGAELAAPRGLQGKLQGTVGSVADPALVVRRGIHLPPGAEAVVYFVTGLGASRDEVLHAMEQLCEPAQLDAVFDHAWVRAQMDLRHLGLSAEEAAEAQMFAGRWLYQATMPRARREAVRRNLLGVSALWPLGISGDAPIAVVQFEHAADFPFLARVTRMHQYLCGLGLPLDLVVLDDTGGGYLDVWMHRLQDELAMHGVANMQRVTAVQRDRLSDAELTLLRATARVWLRAGGPSLAAQLSVPAEDWPTLATAPELVAAHSPARGLPAALASGAEFANGYGGFVEGGRAYQILVQPGKQPPRPWTNVLANPHFGTLVTELGTGYTWWKNARECKVTPWTNDPVLDPPGEAVYLQDTQTGEAWSAAPKPAGQNRRYRVTHGFGYTRVEQLDGDITHAMETVVPLDHPVKLTRLHLRNQSGVTRRIAITYFADWVIGVDREAQSPFVVTEWDDDCRTLLAWNTYQQAFRDAVAFLHVAPQVEGQVAADCVNWSWTGDRMAFFGRGGSHQRPAALAYPELPRKAGCFANACGAVQVVVEIPAGAETTVMLLLGCTSSRAEVKWLVEKYRHAGLYALARRDVDAYWNKICGQVQVQTPDRAMDVLLNGWLLYQALACRLWARTAVYQAGGAFGFRDQLQDSLSLLHADPDIARAQILRNAAHQYEEGDVQHWWHEETGKGIRTRYSDDLLWLPYAVSRYVEHTGDTGLLDERVPYLHSEPLKPDETERYEDTVVSTETGTVLDHCLRAIRRACSFGEHGLPHMGIGDWNDGMNQVGARGRGESVWLGWFLLDVLNRFTHFPAGVLPEADVAAFKQTAERLQRNLNEFAWDGAWFRRAYTDAGTWLGSIQDRECRIDAIAQSWSVLSQGTSEERQRRAMRSFERELVDPHLRVARLLTPAFDETMPSPGYIQGYPPGIRENGGQYTHGVIWSIAAWAMLGARDKAHALFQLLNPITHTQSERDVAQFGNEPYVMTADIYTAPPHEGRGGWSWYTGAAGWMYQVGLESVLGVTRRGHRLRIRPCVPESWASFQVRYRFGATVYEITVHCQPSEDAPRWVVDGVAMTGQDELELVNDGKIHTVEVNAPAAPLETVG